MMIHKLSKPMYGKLWRYRNAQNQCRGSYHDTKTLRTSAWDVMAIHKLSEQTSC